MVIGDVLEEEGRITEAQFNDSGGECLFLTLDATDQTIWQEVVAATVSRLGKLDVLMKTAGMGGLIKMEETSEAEWGRVMATIAKGVFQGTQAAIPEMRKASGGSIINISSQLGLVGVDNRSPPSQMGGAAAHQVHCFATLKKDQVSEMTKQHLAVAD